MAKVNAVIQSIFLGFFLAASLGVATSNFDHKDVKKPTSSFRPEGQWDMEKYSALLSGLFQQPVESLKWEYKEKLPQALDTAIKTKDETAISGVMAELFNRANSTQWEEIKKVSTHLLDVKNKEDKTDAPAIALLERLNWASTGLLDLDGLVKTEKSEAFNKAFFGDTSSPDPAKKAGDFMTEKQNKKEILDLIARANSPNSTDTDRKTAKEQLREKVNHQSAMAWASGQMGSGREKQALDLVEALAWKDPSGQRYLEFFNGNQAERLYLGSTRESMLAALKGYGEKKGGLHTARLAQFGHQNATPTLLSLEGGKIVEKAPAGVQPPVAAKQAAKHAAPVAVAGLTAPPPSNNRAQRGGPLLGSARSNRSQRTYPVRTTNRVGSTASAGGSIFGARCASCHRAQSLEPDAIRNAVTKGTMPPGRAGGRLNAQEQAALFRELGIH